MSILVGNDAHPPLYLYIYHMFFSPKAVVHVFLFLHYRIMFMLMFMFFEFDIFRTKYQTPDNFAKIAHKIAKSKYLK